MDPSAPDKGIWVDRVFTSDKNHVSSVTDAEGNTTRYTWDTAADLLDALLTGGGTAWSTVMTAQNVSLLFLRMSLWVAQ